MSLEVFLILLSLLRHEGLHLALRLLLRVRDAEQVEHLLLVLRLQLR